MIVNYCCFNYDLKLSLSPHENNVSQSNTSGLPAFCPSDGIVTGLGLSPNNVIKLPDLDPTYIIIRSLQCSYTVDKRYG